MKYNPTLALRDLNAVPPGRPMVVAQLGQSLDGRIATPTGKSKYISGKAALIHLHRLRAAVDAVIVGVETVIADDPQLTVRLVDGRSPVRVVIDPSGRMPRRVRCLENARGPDAPRLLLVRADDAPAAPEVGADPCRGIDEIRIPRRADGLLAPRAILEALAERGLRRVLIEGGARTLGHAMQDGCVDFLHVMVSPVILGSGTPGIALPPIDELDEAMHPTAQVFAFEDGDALFACDLRRRRMTHAGIDPAAAGAAAE